MSGLIESTKQRLWDIVNELAQRGRSGAARRDPDLRRPSYGEQSGYVRVDLPFTADLDAVNATLFAFQTDGGDEYVARAFTRRSTALQWSQVPDALQIVFVAGNESAEQDPQLTSSRRPRGGAARHRRQRDLLRRRQRRRRARLAAGRGDHERPVREHRPAAAAVANVATPFDAQLAALNEELNTTYLAFGAERASGPREPVAQDGNAAAMSPPRREPRRRESRRLYRSEWDLVDAVQSGKALADIPVGRAAGRDAGATSPWIVKPTSRRRPSDARICSARSASSPPSAADTSRSRAETRAGPASTPR